LKINEILIIIIIIIIIVIIFLSRVTKINLVLRREEQATIYIYIGNKGLPGKRFGIPLTNHLGILFLIIQRYFQVKILIKYE
jgi:hypothetical protein